MKDTDMNFRAPAHFAVTGGGDENQIAKKLELFTKSNTEFFVKNRRA